MPLERLRITNVRCLSSVELVLGAQENYLFGPNGAGKTSLLESVFLLGRGRSFRTRQSARLIRSGESSLSVYGEVRDRDGIRRVGIGFKAGNLEVRVDGAPAASLVELARVLPVHVIDPRAHELVEAGPSERRRFIDAGVFHVEHGYLDRWRAFRRVLGQRNAVLKSGASASLGVWDAAFVEAAQRVDEARRRYVTLLGAAFTRIGQRLLGRTVALGYEPGWRLGLDLGTALIDSRSRDLRLGFTQVGPHRADLALTLEGEAVRDRASRGQQKLLAAALVIAQVSAFRDATGYGGLLLVDDPAAELDPRALARLRAELEGLEAQLLLTGISEAALIPRAKGSVFHVEHGRVRAATEG
jgi:DNA replication and repair protein RecF